MVTERIESARSRLTDERRRTRAERDAFESFRSRVDRISASPPEPGRNVPPTVRGSPGRSGDGAAAVRDAYEATVMATPHYEADYGDEYAESVTVEFGRELAEALARADATTPVLKRRLLHAAERATDRRDRFLDVLDAERATLDEAERALAGVDDDLTAVGSRPLADCSPRELDRLADDLDHLAARCEDLAASRQTELRRQRRTIDVPTADRNLQAYLYRTLDVTHPVLASVATLSDRVRRQADAVEAARARSSVRP
ncbi:DUF7260 family protein [Halorussus halobius]|uniref:DUF7260 family protein n=1 Tax=Halorussus halobius TaxID=1710537 RepID=UPI001092ACC6|nr:hypothetical protein [Halorussus halobius]